MSVHAFADEVKLLETVAVNSSAVTAAHLPAVIHCPQPLISYHKH